MRAHVDPDQDVATGRHPWTHVRVAPDDCQSGVEPARLQPVRAVVIADPKLCTLANDDVLIDDTVVHHSTTLDHGVGHDDRVAHDRALLNDDTWREDRALDRATD